PTDRPGLTARDEPNPPPGRQFTAYGSFASLIDDEATWVASQAINGGVPNTVAIPMARAYASRRGYCIDPLFWASQPFVPATSSAPPLPIVQDALSTDFPYRRSRFPHYHERFNPIDGVN
ncbi:MAG: hypothetical protein ACK43N_03235, partial [Pirellulaceae bacterium]